MNTGNAASVRLPSPLPRRAVPSPDEDLLSLLRRTATRMGYPDYRWLLRPEGRGWDIKDTDLPLLSAKHDYQILEHLLLLSEEQVYSHTLHRFAAPLAQAHGQPLSAGAQHNPPSLLWLSSDSLLSVSSGTIAREVSFLYQRVHVPGRSPRDLQYRWHWLLANKWSFIIPERNMSSSIPKESIFLFSIRGSKPSWLQSPLLGL